MLSVTSQEWSDLLSNPLALTFLIYLLIGLVIAGIIIARGMKLRRPLRGELLWDKKDHARNVLFPFQVVVFSSPVIFLICIAFWPLVLLWLWANQDESERKNI